MLLIILTFRNALVKTDTFYQ